VTALFQAASRFGEVRRARRALAVGQGSWTVRQESFFQRFQF
jgi:hypothetical protein